MDPFLGEIRMVGFNFAPVGWMLCQGQTLPISQYQALFSLLGTTYGGNGTTTFQLPDLQGRVPINAGNGVGLPVYVQGEKAGTATVTLLASNLPAHSHTITPPVSNVKATSSSPVATFPAPGAATVTGGGRDEVVTPLGYAASAVSGQNGGAYQTSLVGGGVPVSIQPPYLVMNFIIAIAGIFPSRS
jgi:microcystin-dependent protein